MQISTPALKYSGWFLNGVPHDGGRMKMSDGSEYHGDLKMGNPHGEGFSLHFVTIFFEFMAQAL